MSSNKHLASQEYQGRRVKVKHSDKYSYRGLIGAEGTVEVANNGSVGVRLDNYTNHASNKGIFWFKKTDLKIVDAEYLLEEEIQKSMYTSQDHSFIANVVLLNDDSQKEYSFAMYTDEYVLLELDKDGVVVPGQLVVVNPRNYNRRVLGKIVSAHCVEDPDHPGSVNPEVRDIHPTAEVVGVVSMHRFNNKLLDMERKKQMIDVQQRLDQELEKLSKERRDSSHYEHVINTMYPGNETLISLLQKLQDLEGNKPCQINV